MSTLRNTLALVTATVVLAACEGAPKDAPQAPSPPDTAASLRYKPETDEGLGVSVAIVLDNSGSMRDKAKGDGRPKAEVAKIAIERALDATEAAIAKRPDYPVKVALLVFSDTTRTILAMQPYNRDSVRAAIARLPRASGGTAIGDAMDAARAALYRAGTFRKVILVVTDGRNTDGREPAVVAQEIFTRSDGGVGMYFVAFDTDAEKFAFLRTVKGDVVSAQNGAALAASLAELYEGKVLAEAAVEPGAPAVKSTPRSSP